MHCILSGVKIIDPSSRHNNLIKDIRIKDGIIAEIADTINASGDEQLFNFTNKLISPGWFDLLASFGDPGNEQKEDLFSGSESASYGGFTSVGLMPNSHPALHSKSEIEYVINKGRHVFTNIFPYGAVTKNREGITLTDMHDMRTAGAAAYTDGDISVADAGILYRSLQYVKAFSGTIINIPTDGKIAGIAFVNEGKMSTQLGMYGIPDVLEEISVIRDIKLAEYANSKLHIGLISSGKSIPHIREAKRKGIHVTAGVSAYHLFFTEDELHDYNTNFKVNPPLRTAPDREALIEGIKDGTIDAICSFHLPHEADAKQIEFEYAAYGMETLEATFGAANKVLYNKISVNELVNLLSINPRKILDLPVPSLIENGKAELTIFDNVEDWIFSDKAIHSKSLNNGFVGRNLKGKPLALINNDMIKMLKHD